MTAAMVINFPARRQMSIRIERENFAWLVIRGQHGWLFGGRHEAFAEAQELASQDSVAVVVRQ
jgi:hypothetical protein